MVNPARSTRNRIARTCIWHDLSIRRRLDGRYTLRLLLFIDRVLPFFDDFFCQIGDVLCGMSSEFANGETDFAFLRRDQFPQ